MLGFTFDLIKICVPCHPSCPDCYNQNALTGWRIDNYMYYGGYSAAFVVGLESETVKCV